MIKKLTMAAAGVTLALGLVACDKQSEQTSVEKAAAPAKALVSGIDMTNLDRSVRPQDDFFRFVDGSWLKRTEIPADKSNYSSFMQLYDSAQMTLREVVDQMSKMDHKKKGSDEQKLGDFYKSYMDEANIEQLGVTPLNDELAKIAKVQGLAGVNRLIAAFNQIGVDTPLHWDVDSDEKNSNQYVTSIGQGGLGLPDRDYYLKDSEKYQSIRKDYQQYVADLLKLVNYPKADEAAQRIVALEKSLAEIQWSRVELRDPVKGYNKMAAAQFDSLLGDFNWKGYAEVAGLQKGEELVVRQPSYFEGFGKLFVATDVSTWQDYLTFHLVNDYAELLSKPFVDLHFAFFDKRLRGLEQQAPRWKRGIDQANIIVGELLGKFYVKKTFPPEAKARMEDMVKNLMKAYGEGINDLEWMSAETKKAAKEKLSKFTYKIGYPDKWKDYSGLDIEAGDLVGNVKRYATWKREEQANHLGKPVDRTVWQMTPQTVNAYYNPVMNEIVFPAAILQPPFFNMKADDAVNYGGIGAVIGHELGHGFDDQGAQYDGDGNLRNWWSEQDKAEFDKRTSKLVSQYDHFQPFADASVNGKLTLGENIGDLSGMTIAYKAYEMSLEGKKAPTLDGFTGEQRFFMGWAQVWRRKYREEELRKRLMTDPHSPAEYRVNGIMRNMPEFYAAFDVKQGDKLFLAPNERVKIW